MNQLPKVCVFCGKPVRDPLTERKRAREHVFPSWALEEFGVTRDTIEFSLFEAMWDDGASLQVVGTELSEDDPIETQQPRIACLAHRRPAR